MDFIDGVIEEMKQQEQCEQEKRDELELVDPNFVDLSKILTINLLYHS